MQNKKEILTIRDLAKTYHTKQGETKAVEDFSLQLLDGEFIALVGPSGCGKSTILSVLCGLEEKSGGSIERKDKITYGYMLQQDSLFEWKTILENCLIGLEITHNLNDTTKQYVIDLLNTYGLGEFIHSYPSNLSGGMRQRVV